MNDEVDILRQASAGLLYPSESDRPFEAIRIGRVDEIIKGRAFVEQSLDEFFVELLTTDDADRYRALKQTLQQLLVKIRVYRVGATEVDVYILGQTSRGELAGLHTVSIET